MLKKYINWFGLLGLASSVMTAGLNFINFIPNGMKSTIMSTIGLLIPTPLLPPSQLLS